MALLTAALLATVLVLAGVVAVDADGLLATARPALPAADLSADRGNTTVDLPAAPPVTSPAAPLAPEVSDPTPTQPLLADRPAPPLRWEHVADATVTSAVVQGRHVVVATAAGTLSAVDLVTGTPRWQTRLAEDAVQVVAADERSGLVVATTALAEVIGVDGTSGEERWRARVTGPAGSILLAPPAARLAVDTIGTRRSGRAPGDHFARTSGPSADPPAVLVSPTWTSPLIALDGATGAQSWRQPVDGRWVVVPDGVVVRSQGGVERWDLDTGEPRWRLEDPAEPLGVAGGLVVVRSDDALAWLDPETGQERGRVPAARAWWAEGPDDSLLVSDAGTGVTIQAIDATDGIRWTLQHNEARAPAAGGGCCVEVRSTPQGHVLTIDRRGGGADLVIDGRDGTVLADLAGLIVGTDRALVAVRDDLHVLQERAGLSAWTRGQPQAGAAAPWDARWLLPEVTFVVAAEPLVVATRQRILALDDGRVPRPQAVPRSSGRGR